MWDFSSKGLPQGEIRTVNNKGKSTPNLPALSPWAGLHEQTNMQSKRLSDWRSTQKIRCRCCWKVLAISINTSSVGLPHHQATHWLQQLAAPFLENRGASDAKEAAVSREGKHFKTPHARYEPLNDVSPPLNLLNTVRKRNNRVFCRTICSLFNMRLLHQTHNASLVNWKPGAAFRV